MRKLVLLRGCPASGKSTFIRENNLEQYTISSDKIRLLYNSPTVNLNGKIQISNRKDTDVWKFLFNILESRMEKGQFVIIDACHVSKNTFTVYKKLAEKYKYTIYCIDFTENITLEQLKNRNINREEFKQVPEEVIEKMYNNQQKNNLPNYIKVLSPKEFFNKMKINPIDLSKYKCIHHIGDIHGCYEVLNKYLKEGLKEDEYYIFCGDYIDRGIENYKVVEFLLKIMDYNNVTLLEGNHEKWLWKWANDLTDNISKEFLQNTAKELELNSITRKSCRILCRKLKTFFYYTYKEKTIIVTHGGISCLPENLSFIGAEDFIKGTGYYDDNIDESFLKNTSLIKNIYQIHGHRNSHCLPIRVNNRCFNLEGKVEFGGKLRIVTLNGTGFLTVEIDNSKIKPEYKKQESFLSCLQNNSFIKETKLEDNISSFNFNKKVFFNKLWNEQTIKARGLFINTNTEEIVARSYEKFFNINETTETSLESLKNKFKYPLNIFVKYNGFLGLVGYNKETDKLLITTKSTNKNVYTKWFTEIFNCRFSKEKQQLLKKYLKDNNCTLVFEVIDNINDKHIIEYESNELVLLDIIYNINVFKRKDYLECKKFSEDFNIKVKELACTIDSWDEFLSFYSLCNKENYSYKNNFIEGFVIEDKDNFMVKLKTNYYYTWKYLRRIKDIIYKLKVNNTSLEKINEVVNGLKIKHESLYNNIEEISKLDINILDKDIIYIRNILSNNI